MQLSLRASYRFSPATDGRFAEETGDTGVTLDRSRRYSLPKRRFIGEIGGRDRDRTGDPLLAKTGYTRNRRLSGR